MSDLLVIDKNIYQLSSSDSEEEEEEQQAMVKYATQMESGPGQYKEKKYDEIDKFDFDKTPFIEVIRKPEYVHYYIDSDNIETED